MADIIYSEYMGLQVGVVNSQTVGEERDRNSLCGLIGYLVSQEHMMREPIISRIVSVALVDDNISIIWIKRPKPDPVADLMSEILIVKAWNSPIGRHNGLVEFSTFGVEDEEPKVS